MAGGRQGGSVVDAVREFARRASELGARLYDLDTDPGVGALHPGTTWNGRTAELVGDTTDVVEGLWGRWAALRDLADRASAAADDGRHDEARALLGAPIELPDGSSADPAELVDGLDTDIERVTEVATTIGDALAHAARLVAEARNELAPLEERAGSYGVADAAAMIEARAAVARLADQAQVDPAAPDLGEDTQRALERAREVVEAAAERAATLPDRLEHATDDLARLRTLIEQGGVALATAREKVAVDGGLYEPLDAAIVEEEPMGLAPWLERIRAAADRGDVRAATAGLKRWESVAAVHLRNARTIAEANAAPLERRDELRGLLGALRAKAAAAGLAEDARTTELHRSARELLYVAPCPLAQAEAAVETFREHVVGDGTSASTSAALGSDGAEGRA